MGEGERFGYVGRYRTSDGHNVSIAKNKDKTFSVHYRNENGITINFDTGTLLPNKDLQLTFGGVAKRINGKLVLGEHTVWTKLDDGERQVKRVKATTTEQPVTNPTYSKEICEKFNEDNDFVFNVKSNKGIIKRRGENTYYLNRKTNKLDETKKYTGLISFGKKLCGKDFVDKLADGSTIVILMDKFVEYKVVHTYAGGDKHYNAAIQFENTADCVECIGSATSDQMDIIIHMTQDVSWGNKDPESCIKSMRFG